MSFDTLGLPEALVRAVTDSGYTTLTEVQTRAILPALEGKDLMVSASTGSGKTASFVLPSLQRILLARADSTKKREKGMVYGPHILVLTPIRELSMQVDKAATPGRLMDHMQSGKAILENVEMLVLDEADHMLNMIFIDDIRHIVEQLPQNRQTVICSATFGDHVGRLAQDLLRDPMRIDISSHTETNENIEQRLHWADNKSHKEVLLDHILTEREMEQALVFTSTQSDVDWLANRLVDMDHVVISLHGGMPQGRRTSALTTVTTACSSPTARQLSVVHLIGYPSIATPPALLRASRPARLWPRATLASRCARAKVVSAADPLRSRQLMSKIPFDASINAVKHTGRRPRSVSNGLAHRLQLGKHDVNARKRVVVLVHLAPHGLHQRALAVSTEFLPTQLTHRFDILQDLRDQRLDLRRIINRCERERWLYATRWLRHPMRLRTTRLLRK